MLFLRSNFSQKRKRQLRLYFTSLIRFVFSSHSVFYFKNTPIQSRRFGQITSESNTDTQSKDFDGIINGDIHFENVHFAYPARPDLLVLHDLDIVIHSGKTTALVGTSGSGKPPETSCWKFILLCIYRKEYLLSPITSTLRTFKRSNPYQ